MSTRRPILGALIPVLLTAWVFGGGVAGASGTSPAVAIPTNVNVSRMLGNQAETSIAISQTHPKKMTIVSNIDVGDGLFHGWSTDSGTTWNTEVIADGDALGFACCDPSLASDEFGNIFLAYLSSSIVVKVALSTDGGATFSPLAAAAASGGSSNAPGRRLGRLPGGDQPSVTAGHGAVWVTWTGSGGVIQAAGAPVTGQGQIGAFSTPQSVQGSNNHGDYGDIAIGPNGQIFVAYQYPTGGEGPATIYGSLDADGLGAGGFSQAKQILVTNVGGFDYIPAQSGRSVDAETELAWDRTGGPHSGRLYLLFTSEQPQESNDMDIQVQHSEDNGSTWTSPVRVNDDTTTTRSQFNPRIALDPTTGNLAVAWYDCRKDKGNHHFGDTNGIPNDDITIWGSYSTDGGGTFTPNRRISQGVSNDDDAANGVDYGDYEGLAFYGGKYFYAWADNSNSTGDNPDGTLSRLDVYTAKVRVP